LKPTYNPNITTNKEERFHPPLLIIILKLKTNSNKLPSFHLSQPFSLSYRSILPTSLTYVMLLRHQRLLTLRTWCGYRYEMVWKWITTHYFSWNNRNTHYFYLWKCFDTHSKNKRRSRKINLLFKQGMNVSLNKWNSTFIEKERLLPTSLYCFYTEKKTLNWIPIAVIMFI